MRYLSLILVFGLIFSFVPLASAEGSSEELTREAALALAQGKSTQAIELAQKCIDKFSPEAKKIQKALKAKGKKALEGEAKVVFKKYRLLNDVGMCQFIIGESYRVSNQPQKANQAYEKVIMEYPESRTIREVYNKILILEKIADSADSRKQLNPKSKYYTIPITVQIY